jgi:hypothetical protein
MREQAARERELRAQVDKLSAVAEEANMRAAAEQALAQSLQRSVSTSQLRELEEKSGLSLADWSDAGRAQFLEGLTRWVSRHDAELREQHELAKRELEQALTGTAALEQRATTLEQQLADTRASNQYMAQQLLHLRDRRDELESEQIKRLTVHLERLQVDLGRAESALADRDARLGAMQSELAQTRRDLEAAARARAIAADSFPPLPRRTGASPAPMLPAEPAGNGRAEGGPTPLMRAQEPSPHALPLGELPPRASASRGASTPILGQAADSELLA